jgi:CRP-like cAMP-binding protein
MQTRSLSALQCERLADADPQISRNIPKSAFQSIARMQRRMAMLGQTSALEKVNAFLLEMSDVSIARAAPCSC